MTLRNRFHANKLQNLAPTTCQVPKPVMQPFGVSTVFVPLLATWLQGDRRFSKKSVTKKGPGRLVGINAWQLTDFDIDRISQNATQNEAKNAWQFGNQIEVGHG